MPGWSKDVGALSPGHWGYMVAVAKDPLADVSAFESVAHVMKDGEVVRQVGLDGSAGVPFGKFMHRRLTLLLRLTTIKQRRWARTSEVAFIILAAVAGLAAGASANLQQAIAHGIQRLFYGVSGNRLSALGEIHHPWRLLALPVGGLLLIAIAWLSRRRARAPIDVVEANAMHGGRIPFRDNLLIALQTITSNGAGASVGLEATYAQMGGGIASLLGQWFQLRRGDLRTLVGAGAGSAVGAIFGAPLTGAFYAFEIVIGAYTPAAIAPVLTAALVAAFVTRSLGVEPYLIAATAQRALTITDYLAYGGLGLVCALVGIAMMRLVARAEQITHSWTRIAKWRPLIGGFLLIPIALVSPQSLSAGHGALHLNLVQHPGLQFLLVVLALKILAVVISLSMGFRGGLFFASLFLGSLVGQCYADAINPIASGLALDPTDAALVGMAALAVAVVGGPMTLAMLMLETTHDFALMGVVLTGSLLSSAVTRELFGYSFSTWRLHLRGTNIRSPRDIGWTLNLTAGRIMRRDWQEVADTASVADFRRMVPLGASSKAILIAPDGTYQGIVQTAVAYRPDLDEMTPVAELAMLRDQVLSPSDGAESMLKDFEAAGADEMAVVDTSRKTIGVVGENYLRRRYYEEIEISQRELFGET